MIEPFVLQYKLPAYRSKQFAVAFYRDLIESFEGLTTWPKDLRHSLAQTMPFSSLEPLDSLRSADKHTDKAVFKRSNGSVIESVLMRHQDKRNTVCVSCMAGCPVGCVFCATGKMQFRGMLSGREIVDQVLFFARRLRKEQQSVTNVVFMGMGEPLLNLEGVMQAIAELTDPERFGMGARRITISTAGITPAIRKLPHLKYRGRLAISLHAPNQQLREQLIPIAKRYEINALIQSVKRFALFTQLRISYEYILIDNLNDRPEHAISLAKLVGPELTHVNLIPYNPVAGVPFKRSPRPAVHRFSDILTQEGISNTIRVTMGDDILAACGQLAGSTQVKAQSV